MEITDLADVVEDQIFLLNVLRLLGDDVDVQHILEGDDAADLFLSEECMEQSLELCLRQLFILSPHSRNEHMLGVIMRAASALFTLLRLVHGRPSLSGNDTNSVADIDHTVCTLVREWTTASSESVLRALGRLLSFLVRYGSLHILPEGIYSVSDSCFFCRFESALEEDDINRGLCNHYVVEKGKTSCGSGRPAPHSDAHRLEEESCNDHSDGFPVNVLAQFRDKEVDMRKMHMNIADMHERLREQKDRMDFLASAMCISPFLYLVVAMYMLFLRRRLQSVEHFFPDNNCIGIDQALSQEGIRNVTGCQQRLGARLSRISLSKMNVTVIHEKFESLLLDPVTLFCKGELLLRVSILTKKFLLALGCPAKDVVADFEERCRATPDSMVHRTAESPQEKLYRAVFLLSTYNSWLSSFGVAKCNFLEFERGDADAEWTGHLTFLFDFCQVGFHTRDDVRVHGVCDDVLSFCLLHFRWLTKQGVCPSSVHVRDIFDLTS